MINQSKLLLNSKYMFIRLSSSKDLKFDGMNLGPNYF